MNTIAKLWTRREFLKTGSLWGAQFLLGGLSGSLLVEAKPNHHTEKGFRNDPPTPDLTPDFGFMLRRFRGSFSLPEVPPDHSLSEEAAIAQLNELKQKNTLTWLGHATFLMRLHGKTILTDPFLTEYASPFIVGPKRFVPPGISIEKLPLIDSIVISHNHYDHLDEKTVESLPGKETIRVFVPLGLKKFFTQKGYTHVREMDWGERASWDGMDISALPAAHFSGRGIRDRNKTLWCSWAIRSASGNCFFAGDTGYAPSIFRKIGSKYKSFDLAMVPIGAYAPRKVMATVHTNPEEAIDAGMDINANVMVGMHWGTIELSDEPHWEPPKRFLKKARKMGISQERAWIMKIGETRILPG